MVSVLLVDLYYLAKAMRNPEPGSLYIAIGFFAIMLLFPLAILNIMFTVDLYYFLPFSLPILAISQALYMSQKYTNAFQIIQRLSEQLQSLNLVKDEFLAKTSHELKTPLN
jgi:signal transduction histidine kinase